ncbi:MAG: HNH endonuclease [Chloroflexia bacterium]|nr:HNH endonuclease [Chloroflexia bacterium]
MVNYRDYLNSYNWQQRRQFILQRDGHRCRQCGDAYRLEVHHLTYRRLGREHPNDLMTLCRPCHESVHQRIKQSRRWVKSSRQRWSSRSTVRRWSPKPSRARQGDRSRYAGRSSPKRRGSRRRY